MARPVAGRSVRGNAWTVAAGIALALPATWAATVLLRDSADHRAEFFDVRLGMTSREVRAHWTRPGVWSNALLESGAVAIDWRADDPADPFASVRFELHQGVLVAVRAEIRPELADAAIVAATETAVSPEVLRQRVDDGQDSLHFVMIARSCPVHVEEVEERLEQL